MTKIGWFLFFFTAKKERPRTPAAMAANQARKTEAGEKRMMERIPILWSANMKRYTDTKNGVVKGESARVTNDIRSCK